MTLEKIELEPSSSTQRPLSRHAGQSIEGANDRIPESEESSDDGREAFECVICGSNRVVINGYSPGRTLREHAAIHMDLKPFKCSACSFRTTRLSGAKRHSMTVHNELVPIRDERDAAYYRELKAMNARCFPGLEQKMVEEEEEEEEEEDEEDEEDVDTPEPLSKTIACMICGRKLARMFGYGVGNLKDHAARHLTIRPFECSLCSFRGTRYQEAKLHSLRHHNGLVPIHDHRDDAYFRDYKAMQVRCFPELDPQHGEDVGAKESLPKNTKVCMICGNKLKRKLANGSGNLKEHASRHLDLKPFECSLCSFRSTNVCTVRVHSLRIHKELVPIHDYRDDAYYSELRAMKARCFPEPDSQQETIAIEEGKGEDEQEEDVQEVSVDIGPQASIFKNAQACTRCGKINKTPNRALSHARIHMEESWNLFGCSECDYKGARHKTTLQLHLKRKHEGNGKIIDRRDDAYFRHMEVVAIQCFPGLKSKFAASTNDFLGKKNKRRALPKKIWRGEVPCKIKKETQEEVVEEEDGNGVKVREHDRPPVEGRLDGHLADGEETNNTTMPCTSSGSDFASFARACDDEQLFSGFEMKTEPVGEELSGCDQVL